MSISNFQETLLMYAREKSRLNLKFSDIQFNLSAATRKAMLEQQRFNDKMTQYSYMYTDNDLVADEYEDLIDELEIEYEFNLKNLDSWEEQLQLDKDNLELKLSEITANEASFRGLLKTDIKNDFSYGGAQQG